MQIGVNFSVAGTMGAFSNIPEVKPTEKSSNSSQVTSVKKTTQVGSPTGLEAGGATEFLKQESINIREDAVSEVAVKPNILQIETKTLSVPEAIEAKEAKEASSDGVIKQLQDSVNRDILVAMADSGSLFN